MFILCNQKGQSLIEYLILVALMGIATIGIVRVLSQTTSAKLATITHALQGRKKSISTDTINENLYRKKDLSSFMIGVGHQSNKDTGQ